MKSIVVSGKNIEKAIEEGLSLLNTTFENVDIKVISEGGLFKKATVELTLSEDALKQKAEKKEKLEQLEKKLEAKEKKQEEVVKTLEVINENNELEQELDEDIELKEKLDSIEQELQEIQKSQEVSQNKADFEKEVIEEINKFLNGLLYAYNIIAKVETVYQNREYNTSIIGENLGVLIGYHGDSLQAIQLILSNYIFNKLGKNVRISLDIENYREKRIDALKNMAESLKEKVLINKRSLKLEPMSSFERKVIHSHLQDISNIKTHSEGQEPNRFLIIEYVE